MYVSVPESSRRVVGFIEGDMVVSLETIVFIGTSEFGNRSPGKVKSTASI
jgi:hypothetical protein